MDPANSISKTDSDSEEDDVCAAVTPATRAAAISVSEEERQKRLEDTVAFHQSARAKLPSESKLQEVLSFGGTIEDFRAEREFAMIATGTDVDRSLHMTPVYPEADDGTGTWMRFISVSGCYAYVHTLTCAVTFTKPEEWVDYNAPIRVDGAGVRTCRTTQLPAMIDELISAGKTPLLLDQSSDCRIRTFYTYKGMVLDLQALCRSPVLGGPTPQQALETMRDTLVGAMKAGATLAIFLGTAVPCFLTPAKYTSPLRFPASTFEVGGLIQASVRQKFYRTEDKMNDYEARLSAQLPLDKMAAVVIEHET